MSPEIPFLRPSLPPAQKYLRYLNEMDASHLYSNYGPLNARFEQRLLAERFAGVGAVLTATNATAALALALRHLARPGGRYVVMPSFTFAATPLAATWAGLEPYFVDIDPDTWLTDEAQVHSAVDRLGRDVAAVLPYTTFGAPMPLDAYDSLVRDGVPVVVDAAPTLGSQVGGVQFGVGFPGVVVFSMHCTKPFGIGEGGLIYSADTDAVAHLRRAGNFGFDDDRAATAGGFNTKLPEVLAAIALAQLDQFDQQLDARARVHRWYLDAFSRHDPDGRWTLQRTDGDPAHQFFPVLVPPGRSGDERVAALAAEGVQARRYFAPVCHRQPAFAAAPRDALAVTEDFDTRILSLPLWDGLSEADVDRVVSVACR